jgi:hypothetical protein
MKMGTHTTTETNPIQIKYALEGILSALFHSKNFPHSATLHTPPPFNARAVGILAKCRIVGRPCGQFHGWSIVPMCRTTYPGCFSFVRRTIVYKGREKETHRHQLHGAQCIPHHHTASARARGEHCARFGTADHSAGRGVMEEGDQFL